MTDSENREEKIEKRFQTNTIPRISKLKPSKLQAPIKINQQVTPFNIFKNNFL